VQDHIFVRDGEIAVRPTKSVLRSVGKGLSLSSEAPSFKFELCFG
jgi:hypothetical protein